jgi:hypothetical protein
MDFAIQRGHVGITADEVSTIWECSPNHCAPRICELKASGQLVPTDRCRATRAGARARVLVAHQFAQPAKDVAASLFPNEQHWDMG